MGTPAADVLKPDHAASRRHFIFTEEHDRLREAIHAFVTKELAPHADAWEETTFPDAVFRRMGELGLLGLSYPEEYGGQGGDYFCNLVLAEEMTYSNSGGLAMDVAVIRTRAVRDGDEWVINGSKTYITNGHRADFIVLVAKTDPGAGHDGVSLFLVDMDLPGVVREKKLEKLGMHASDTAL